MIDRQPTHAGRVQLVPVAGQTNIYDMSMADGATEQGTPLNKANLLKDATAALYGLTNAAVPDDVLAALSKSALCEKTEQRVLDAGATWKLLSNFNGEWTRLAYGDGKFIAVSTTSMAWFGTADSFTTVYLPIQAAWKGICYGNGRWVACTAANAATSTDGTTWATSDLPSGITASSVCYGNGKFVIVGESAIAAVSTDGQTWSSYSMPSGYTWWDVTYGNGKYVAVGQNAVAYSVDGHTWTLGTIPNGQWGSIAYGNGKFVVIDIGTSRNAAYSQSAETWTSANLPTNSAWKCVCFGYDKFVVTSNGTNGAYSRDGRSWQKVTFPDSRIWQVLAYGNDCFLSLARSAGNLMVSYDAFNVVDTLTDILGAPLDVGKRIVVGDYVGTGTYGASSPNSLNFDFTPLGIIIVGYSAIGGARYGNSYIWSIQSTYAISNFVTWSGQSVSWYTTDTGGYGGAANQFNYGSQKYMYIAFG